MDAATFQSILLGLVAFFFGLLVMTLGWIGVRLHSKQDDLYKLVGSVGETLLTIERDLRDKLGQLDRRVTQSEALAQAESVRREATRAETALRATAARVNTELQDEACRVESIRAAHQ